MKFKWEEHEWQGSLYQQSYCKKCGIVFHRAGIYSSIDNYGYSCANKRGHGLRLEHKELSDFSLIGNCAGSEGKLIRLIKYNMRKNLSYWKDAIPHKRGV